jgi:hypothetical protein
MCFYSLYNKSIGAGTCVNFLLQTLQVNLATILDVPVECFTLWREREDLCLKVLSQKGLGYAYHFSSAFFFFLEGISLYFGFGLKLNDVGLICSYDFI